MRDGLRKLVSGVVVLVGGCGGAFTSVSQTNAPPPDVMPIEQPSADSSGDIAESSPFVHAFGTTLVTGGGSSTKTILLRGMNVQSFWLLSPDDLSNPFFDDENDRGVPTASLIPDRFDGTVVSNIASMGMNVIRNAVNFRQFEDNANPFVYKPEGWALLDRQIELAKQAGIYTIIDLHVPPGGLQGQIGPSARLWEDSSLRGRTESLWRAIAERYRDEPWVAGYDIINEPMPTRSPRQWADFARELVATIREVDTNHLIIVEEIIAVVDAQGNYPPIDPDEPWLPEIDDDNVMYDFHFYKPIDYVGQGRPENGLGDNGQAYPDEAFQYRDEDGRVIGVRNKAYLKLMLDEKLAFQRTYNAPINVGEFSPSRTTYFDNDAEGGLTYTADLMDLFNDANLNYQFYAYLNVFFLDWEYAQSPELYDVTDAMVATLTEAMR